MAFKLPTPPHLEKALEATKVDYVQLGKSGLRISVPILGAMSMGTKAWMPWCLEEDESIEVLKAAYDCGINTWDTADMYSNGVSEEIIGKAIKKLKIPRDKLVIMTKAWSYIPEDPSILGAAFYGPMSKAKDYVNRGGLSRKALFRAVDDSLARLGTSYIDVLQIHRLDDSVPPEEIMEALHDLVVSGKVLYIGASAMWATQFARLQFIAEKNNWTKFVSMQNYYNLLYREEEREMIRFCNETGVGIIPYSPMDGGKLARPLGNDDSARAKMAAAVQGPNSKADDEIVKRVEELAKKKGWPMSHVALAWLRSKGAVPIVGFNSVKRITEASELRGKTLTEEEGKSLEEPYIPKAVSGHS